jgi:hypothetical protein
MRQVKAASFAVILVATHMLNEPEAIHTGETSLRRGRCDVMFTQ